MFLWRFFFKLKVAEPEKKHVQCFLYLLIGIFWQGNIYTPLQCVLTNVRVCQGELAQCHITSINFILFCPLMIQWSSFQLFILRFKSSNYIFIKIHNVIFTQSCKWPTKGVKPNVLGSRERPDVPLQHSYTVCCACGVLMKIIVNYHRDVQSSSLKRHLYLIA